MTAIEAACDVFTMFHDGSISSGAVDEGNCELCIDIEYLAERVESGFTKFKLRLQDFSDFKFLPWDGEAFSEFDRIAAVDLGILSSTIVDGEIEVVCSQGYHDLGFAGGVMKFSLSKIEIYDELGRELSLDELKSLSAGYWDDWERKSGAEGNDG